MSLFIDDHNRRTLLARYPEEAHKVHLLSEYHPSVSDPARAPDIFDPIGRPIEDFRQCFGLLRDAMQGWVRAELEAGA